MRSFIIKPGDLIPIGRAGENQATQIRFDVTGWAEAFGAGTYTLVVKRPHEDTAYPVEVAADGDYVVWTVSNVDTGIAGNASVQLRYVVDGALAKSVIYTGIVGESLDNIVDPPDPFEDLIQRMVDLAERTEAAAESAAGSATSASESAGTATAAKNAAEAANTAAQSAKTAAQSANTDAQSAKTDAQSAKTAAEAAQSAAASSATAASGSATAAAGSASQAAASATAAAGSAAAAAQSAAAAQAAAMDVIDKAPIITDTASGAIASFPDGADEPIKQLTVQIEPQQDLHGYDAPWPAGGGKNKLPLKFYGGVGYNVDAGTVFDTSTEYTDGTVSGNTVTFTVGGWGRRCMLSDRLVSGESYYISMEVTSANLRFTWYTLDADLKTVRKYEVTGSGTSKTVRNPVTMSETECYIAIYLGSSAQGDISFTEPQIEVGNAKTAYAPYSNICPITGWTGATVTRTGKNLLNKATMKTSTPGSRFAVFGADSYYDTVPNGEIKLDAGNYTFSLSGANSTNAETIAVYDEANTRIKVTYNNKVSSFTVEKAGYFIILCTIAGANFVSWDNYDIQLERGSAATDFVPYVGASYPITWQSEAGTVYGGTLTVNQDGSVDVVADRAYFDGGSKTWAKLTDYANGNFWTTASNIKYAQTRSTIMSSLYKPSNNNSVAASADYYVWVRARNSTTNDVYVKDTSKAGMTAAEFKTAMTGVQFVYELVTPVTYHITAQQMTTLLGTNNWWSNTGNIENLEYRCDTRRYIDKKLAALLAALS